MTFCASPIEKPDGFRIGEERGDLLRNVASRKWLRIWAEFRDQPVEQQTAVWIGEVSFAGLMFLSNQFLPGSPILSIESDVVNSMAAGTIRPAASVARLLHGQILGEKRQDLRLNPLGNLVGVVAFVSLERVHDSEIGHHLF